MKILLVQDSPVSMIDPSLLLRPEKVYDGKPVDAFRNYDIDEMKDALIKLNELVDESDPDTDLPNIVHAFQTAERIREEHPDEDWFHLIGLIHDLGKSAAIPDIEALWPYYEKLIEKYIPGVLEW
ncbi:hypothetical protein HF086_009925 [Spodoptera exigua]|uniref:Inositol oxygenase n=1 Tax=Spodoptera exigua TaxID=7107 RepID=A0A922M4M1_SPOEX|nr:hypothetical protein HF086_009925 [Spodoptera exigua]